MCLLSVSASCAKQNELKVISGAENHKEYLQLLEGKSVGLVGNQSSLVENQHLVDFLVSKKLKFKEFLVLSMDFVEMLMQERKLKTAKM